MLTWNPTRLLSSLLWLWCQSCYSLPIPPGGHCFQAQCWERRLNISGISLLGPPWEDNRGYSLFVQNFHHCQGFFFICDGLAWLDHSLMFASNAAPVSSSASNWLGMATSARGRIVSWYTGSNSLRNEKFDVFFRFCKGLNGYKLTLERKGQGRCRPSLGHTRI